MGSTTFYIPKKYGSYGDGLVAVGMAEMLSILFGTKKIIIKDEQGYFTCTVTKDIELDDMDIVALKNDPGYQYIQFKENEKDIPLKTYLYFQEQELYRAEKERKKNTKQQEKMLGNDDPELNQIQKSKSDYLLMQSLRVLQGLGASNKLYKEVQKSKSEDLKSTIIQRLKVYSNPVQAVPKKEPFKPSVSAVQAYNPIIGKGVNKAKANSVAVSSIPSGFVDWFEEWLRFIGSQLVLNAYPMKDDLKFIAIIPKQWELSRLENIREKFLKIRSFTSIKNDILVTLGLVQILVEQSEEYQAYTKSFTRRTPKDIILGLSTAYFKSLGSGRALVNNSFLAMPDWFSINSKEDKKLWNELVNDHEKVLKSLDEDKQEDMQLLMYYRDFLSSSEWKRFFLYLSSYASIYMQRREKKKYAVQHSLSILERMCQQMGIKYGDIITNESFKEVARAIREATVQEQYRKSQKKQQFQIKYGLFQELKRKAKFKDQVIGALSEFLNEYNAETARKMEQLGDNYKGRNRVSLSALEELTSIFDRNPKQHETITLLLIAAASCYDDTNKQKRERV